jgi:hypothetical protein
MKLVLKLSLLSNLLLVACLICVMAQGKRGISQHPNPAPGASDAPGIQVAASLSPTPPVESKPFSWSHIESADYGVYVANLRGIGCPEQTIRDILTADVHGAFAPRREALERKQKNQNGSDLATRLTLQSVEAGLEELRDEEAQLIKELLDPQDFRGAIGSRSIASAREQWHRRHDPISVPLVLQNVDLASLNLDENRTQFICKLREGFVQEIGGYNQDPNDPEYRKRWQVAQAKSDQLLRAMLGNRAYDEYQLRATPDTGNSSAQP